MTHAEAKPSLYRNVRIHPSARLSPAPPASWAT